MRDSVGSSAVSDEFQLGSLAKRKSKGFRQQELLVLGLASWAPTESRQSER